jgi:2-polyprenyl-3-methyl-5-hydroxy-6-metoxy-1,4-benzoquinol methylase
VIIKILSQNSNLGYVIGKNPNTPPKAVGIRKGAALGWFQGPSNYAIRFVDGNDEVSFPQHKDDSYEYLSPTKYCSAMCALSLINEFAAKTYPEHDTLPVRIQVISLHVKSRTRRTLSHYFPSCLFECIGYEDYHTLTVDASTASEALRITKAILLFVMLDHEYFFADDGFIKKYAKIVAECPYFVRYLFKTNLLKSRNAFDKVRPIITDQDHEFVFGGLNDNRIQFVSNNIGKKVLDVGCGEGTYLKRFAKNADLYVGVDIDIEQVSVCEKIIKKRELNNTFAVPSIQEATVFEDFDTALCIEVIEHMDWDKVPAFLKRVSAFAPKVLVTTPDVRFNQYYPVESRHDDHCWEKSPEEVQPLLTSIFKTVEYVPIGDSVCGVTPTQGYICYG